MEPEQFQEKIRDIEENIIAPAMKALIARVNEDERLAAKIERVPVVNYLSFTIQKMGEIMRYLWCYVKSDFDRNEITINFSSPRIEGSAGGDKFQFRTDEITTEKLNEIFDQQVAKYIENFINANNTFRY